MMATLRRYSDPREASWRPPPAQPLAVTGGTKITVRSVKTAEGDVGCGVWGEQGDVAGRPESTGGRVGALGSDALVPRGLGQL